MGFGLHHSYMSTKIQIPDCPVEGEIGNYLFLVDRNPVMGF